MTTMMIAVLPGLALLLLLPCALAQIIARANDPVARYNMAVTVMKAAHDADARRQHDQADRLARQATAVFETVVRIAGAGGTDNALVADAWVNLGSLYARHHRGDEAAYERAIAVHPGNARANANLGNMYIRKRDHAAAVAAYARAAYGVGADGGGGGAEQAALRAVVLGHLAKALFFNLDRYDEAAAAYEAGFAAVRSLVGDDTNVRYLDEAYAAADGAGLELSNVHQAYGGLC